MRHNQAIQNVHFCKDWRSKVHTWYKQPFRKIRRHQTRIQKAKAVFPNTIRTLKPTVHCMNQRYNYKMRLGKGFTLEELRRAKIDKNIAKTIGISVDARRKDSSKECLERNTERLKEYMNRLVVLPKTNSQTSKRIKLNKQNEEKRNKKAAEIKQFLNENNKEIKQLKKEIAQIKIEYLKTKDENKKKELKIKLRALKKVQLAFAKKMLQNHKNIAKASKMFNKLPVQLKQAKQVLDANKVIKSVVAVPLETKVLTKGLKAFDAVAHLEKAKNRAKAVSGIEKGKKKAPKQKK